MENVMAVILAGGYGERLGVLAQERAKPAIPIAGKYRIIDFTLSNCANSEIDDIAVLTQYQPLSLADHIGSGVPWGYANPGRGVRLLQPYLSRDQASDWYQGTADAVYQNIGYVDKQNADYVLVLSGDHVYKMDYRPMIDFHIAKGAEATLAVTEMPEEVLSRFGTVVVDEDGRITRFQEKVKKPQSNLVSMGVYVFGRHVLRDWLEETARLNKNDFGRHVFPRMAGKGDIFAYRFKGYWRDVGTMQTYWQTNMEVLNMGKRFLEDVEWPIITTERSGRPPAYIGGGARIRNSLFGEGCVVEGHVENSVLFPGVHVADGASVKDSVLMDDTQVAADAVVDRCILDKEVSVARGSQIGFGFDFKANRTSPEVLDTGLTIIGKRARIPAGTKIGRNTIVYNQVEEADFPSGEVPSGSNVKPRRRRRK